MGDNNTGPEDYDVHNINTADIASAIADTDIKETEEWKKAESFRKAEIYGRAAKTFRKFWEETKDPEAGWRYAHCLRKSGISDSSLKLLQELQQSYPEHQKIGYELVWGIYEAKLVPAKEKNNCSEIMEAAREMIAAEATGIPLKLAVFAAVSAAKSRGQWKLVSRWCDLLEPSQLDSATRQTQHGSIPSDRERWYFAKLKALIHQEEWHTALTIAHSACADFPRNADFLRWQASSLAGMGQLKEALELLEGLRPKIAWYALADMAKYCLELEDVEGAWALAQEAARGMGQDSAKVNLWELMARISLALGNSEAALHHIGIMQAIRTEQNWPLRPSHHKLIELVIAESGLSRLASKSSKEWKTLCRQHWGTQPKTSGVASSDFRKSSNEPQRGKVRSWEEGKSFAFISPAKGGEPVFVLIQDLPPEAWHNGAQVVFDTIKHFDKKKNRDSLRAVRVGIPETG